MHANSTKDIPNNKEAENSRRGSREILSRLFCFYRLYRTTDSRPIDKKEGKCTIHRQEEKTYCKESIMVNNRGYIIHKANHKKGKRHDYDVYKKNYPVTPKQVVNVIDLGYLGVEKDFPEQLSSHCRIKKIETNKSYLRKKKNITKSIPRRG